MEALDNAVPTASQTTVYLDSRRLLDRAVRWLVTNRRSPLDVPAEIARLRDGVARLLPELERLFQGDERAALTATDRRADRAGPAAGAGRTQRPG